MLTVVTPATSGDLVSLARVKTELSISGTGEDAKLEDLITEASGLIAGYCNRDGFGAEDLLQTERLTSPRECIILARDLAPAIDTVTVDGTALGADEFELDGSLLYRLSSDARTCWSSGKVVIAYSAGWTLPDAAPPALSRAALDLVVGMHRGAGRDAAIRSEQVEGVGQTAYFDWRGTSLPLSADRVTALERYRLVGVG